MTARNCTVGNYQLEKVGENEWQLHYTGEGWQTVTRTTKQVEESESFFDLWMNY